jgi:transposase-like protein
MKERSASPASRSDTSNTPKKGRKPPVAPTPEKQAQFLALLREGRTVEGAARAVAIHRSTLYRFRDRSEEFKREWDEAWEAGIEALEDELRRRGFEGVEKPVFHGG